MKIITRFESVWDEELEQYVTVAEESYEYDGDVAECKGGGKGGKGGGAILGIVASIAIPFVAPQIAAAITGTSVAAVSTAAVAATGAGLGAISAAVTGGDPLKGALMGGVSAGMGAGFGGTTGAGNPVNGWFGGADGISAVTATPSYVDALGGMTDATGTALAGFDGGAAVSGLSNAGYVDTLGGSYDASVAGFNTATTPTATNVGLSTPTATSAPTPATADKPFLETTLGKAGLQLGTNALSSALVGDNGMSAYTDALNQQTALANEAYNFNKGQAQKKNAIGDQVIQDTTAYSPEYYANQSASAVGIQQDNAWADYEQRLRAQGRDDNYINAEKQRYGLEAGLKKSSAYDSGYTQGVNRRYAGLQTGAGMYDSISSPNYNMAGYQYSADKDAKDAAAIGGMLEKAGGIDQKTDAEQKKLSTAFGIK